MNLLHRPGSWPSFVLALSVLSLGACSSAFRFTVRSPEPKDVESVLVLFGKEADFEGRTSTADIAALLRPAKFDEYRGYAEFGVEATEAGPVWTERSARLTALQAGYEVSERQPREVRFRVPRSMFEAHPDLAIAVVVRTADRQYRMQRWQRATMKEAEDALYVDVDASKVVGSY
jgi:hypothetical protein